MSIDNLLAGRRSCQTVWPYSERILNHWRGALIYYLLPPKKVKNHNLAVLQPVDVLHWNDMIEGVIKLSLINLNSTCKCGFYISCLLFLKIYCNIGKLSLYVRIWKICTYAKQSLRWYYRCLIDVITWWTFCLQYLDLVEKSTVNLWCFGIHLLPRERCSMIIIHFQINLSLTFYIWFYWICSNQVSFCYNVKHVLLSTLTYISLSRFFSSSKIGEVLNRLFKDGVVKRQDLFITSKLWYVFRHFSNNLPPCLL